MVTDALSPGLAAPLPNRLIYVLEPEAAGLNGLAAQVASFGFEIRTYASTDAMLAAVKQLPPRVLLVGVSGRDNAETRYAEIAMLRAETVPPLPVVVIAENGDLPARLQAVRAGAGGYFVLPLDTSSLVDALGRYVNADKILPFHILIVEDSLTQASLFAMQLKRAGMVTRIVSDALQIIPHLLEFNPDLILMDVYMPGCSGIEMAQVIRQLENFVSVPIVFLSAEMDLDRQLEALEFGADDFLTKPIKPRHLISAITFRVERYRRLRALMVTDGLTALLNHTTFKENLARELLRAERDRSTLSFAMIDLDHFKQINDQHGHAMGDRVLRSLAQLLRQRLRRTDLIGRYGGEEFAVIFPSTSAATAAQILDDLRVSFGEVIHSGDDQEVMVTFSCGVASVPPCTSLSELGAAAEIALNKAKQQGRNQIVVQAR